MLTIKSQINSLPQFIFIEKQVVDPYIAKSSVLQFCLDFEECYVFQMKVQNEDEDTCRFTTSMYMLNHTRIYDISELCETIFDSYF